MSKALTYEEAFVRDMALSLKDRKQQKVTHSVRMYAAAKTSRLTTGWGVNTTSADTELWTSLATLRARSRQLVRDAAYAKRAKVIVVNNIVGSGIGMQAQVITSRGQLNNRVNDEIEQAWELWSRAENCHIAGVLGFADIERMLMGQVFEAGEIFARKHFNAVGESTDIPFALEIIEPERMADQYQPSALVAGAKVRMGIEQDRYYRPLAYWFRQLHPGEIRLTAGETDRLERMAASLILHLRIIDRWPQTRGEPWLHAVARRLNDMEGYSEAEIVAARGAASYMGIIESPEGDVSDPSTDPPEIEIEPGIIEKLLPGEKFNFVNPNRPNAQMDPFMRLMLREVAAGVGVSYESLSRDYSQSNYSSSRLALLDDRDLWRTLQLWFIRNFRDKVHRAWLQQAVLSRSIKSISVEEYAMNPEKFNAVRFKPRGWSWIDPTKEVAAYKEAEKAGYITKGRIISLTSEYADVEDMFNERVQELQLQKEKGLKFDTDPDAIEKKEVQKPVEQEEISEGGNNNGKGN